MAVKIRADGISDNGAPPFFAKVSPSLERLQAIGGTVVCYYPFDGDLTEDRGPNGYDLPGAPGAPFLDPNKAGERWLLRADSVQTVAAAAARINGAVSIYSRSLLAGTTGSSFIACYDTAIGTDPLWGFGRTSGYWAIWDKQATGVVNGLYNPSRSNLLQSMGYNPETATAIRNAAATEWKIYRQGKQVGVPLNQPSEPGTIVGSEVLAVGGSGSAKWDGYRVVFAEEHDAETARVIEYLLEHGRV